MSHPGIVLREHEPMARHSPWRVGGPVEGYVVVVARDAVGRALALCRDHGWKRQLLGSGTRTVFRDAGAAGVVLRLGAPFAQLEEAEDGWWIGGAAPLALLGVAAGKGPLAALRFHGGTMGASLSLDEGWEPWVQSVRWVQREREHTSALSEIPGKGSVVITEVLVRRTPTDGPKTKGPRVRDGWFATEDDDEVPAELLRDSGLSATRLRGVLLPSQVPDRLVNVGGATAKDLVLLQKSLIEKVHEKRGVMLQDRMTWIGRP